MATLINNAGVQHYANKMVLAENRKVGSKSLPTALNDIDNLIDEMKTQFDAEYGSALDMKLENNENIFSVGTGTNVDKSSEVENSFTDVELSGNSLVNLFDYKSFIPNASSGIYAEDNGIKFIVTEPSGSYLYQSFKKPIYKDTTDYTFIVNITKNTFASNVSVFRIFRPENTNGKGYWINGGITGLQKIKITTDSKASDWNGTTTNFGFNCGSSGELIIKDMILLEGDWTNKPIPQYFEGMKSVGQDDVNGHKIEILSQNKNLFDGVVSSEYSNPNINFNVSSDGVLSATNKTLDNREWSYDKTQYRMKLKKGNYTITLETITPSTSQYSKTIIYKKGATDSLCIFERNTMDRVGVNSQQISLNEDTDIGIESKMFDGTFRIQIEKGSQSTTFTPYKENKKEISLNEPFRGLPNGVKDTIEKINGEWKIVRRCGEYRFDETSKWVGSDIRSNGHWIRVIDSDIPNFKNRGCLIATVEVFEDTVWKDNDLNRLGVWDWSGMNFYIFIPSKLSGWDVANPVDRTTISLFMKTNAINIIYELETQTIEDIDPITLQCWKNGTIFIDEVLPVETTHTVALNKPAQIKRNIEELTALRKRVQALEDFYDQIALEQAHQLSLINHSIELDYNI